jgi:hypothetical protein
MVLDTITFLVVVGLFGAILWDMHRTNVRAHIRTQEILDDIARFLGTDRR